MALPAAITLRYVYKPGQVTTFTFSDVSSSTLQSGRQPAVKEWTQTITGTARKSILSAAGNQGVVEEATTQGSVERTDPRGTTAQLLPASTRRYTFNTLGKMVKMERLTSAGQPDTRPQPLDGFTFSLPEKPVTPGTKWIESVRVVGLDGKPMTVAATSTYRGETMRGGHSASQIDVAFTSAFTVAQTGSETPMQGSLKGTVTYYLARDLGQEVESSNDMTITFQSTAAGGKSGPIQRTLHFQQTRKLAK